MSARSNASWGGPHSSHYRVPRPVGLAGSAPTWAFSVADGLVDMVSSRKPSLHDERHDERRKLTVVAVIAFIAAFICLIIYWNRAGDVSQPKTEDVSQAKTEADCQKAGGMWDMNMCMEKKQSKTHRLTQKRGRSTGG